jgi:hypothetical protein
LEFHVQLNGAVVSVRQSYKIGIWVGNKEKSSQQEVGNALRKNLALPGSYKMQVADSGNHTVLLYSCLLLFCWMDVKA